MFTITYGNSSIELTLSALSRSKLLVELSEVSESKEIVLSGELSRVFPPVADYLLNGKMPSVEEFESFKVFQVTTYLDYELSLVLEKDMRQNMYKTNDKKYQENYYGLTVLTPDLWEALECNRKPNENLLFDGAKFSKRDHLNINTCLKEFHEFFKVPGVFIAGGSIVSCLFDLETSNDIDLFLYSCTPEEATSKVLQLGKILEDMGYSKEETRVCRTKNAVTFMCEGKRDVQIILRLYSTVSEIIHGFDVDSCCVGYDGHNILLTTRALYSFNCMTNTVNFDYLSPSYERRLAKYGLRGFAIQIPGFDRKQVNEIQLENDYLLNYSQGYGCVNTMAKHVKEGLDVLLYLEKVAVEDKYGYISNKLVKLETDVMSDYSSEYAYDKKNLNKNSPLKKEILLFVYLFKQDHKIVYPIKQKLMQLYLDYGIDFSCGVNCYFYIPEDTKLSPEGVKIYNTLKKFYIAKLSRCDKIRFLETSLQYLDLLIDFHPSVWDIVESFKEFEFPLPLTWKTTNPGEQMTNTFHSLVLEDTSTWYKGMYYGCTFDISHPRAFRCELDLTQNQITDLYQSEDYPLKRQVINEIIVNLNSNGIPRGVKEKDIVAVFHNMRLWCLLSVEGNKLTLMK